MKKPHRSEKNPRKPAKKNPRKPAKKNPRKPAKKNPRKPAKKNPRTFALPRRKLVPLDTPEQIRGAEKSLTQLAKAKSITRGELYDARQRVRTLAERRAVKLPKRNPGHGHAVTFRLAGTPPTQERLTIGTRQLASILTSYEPAKVSDTRAYWPWLARRWAMVDLPESLLLWSVIDLANANVVAVYADEDRLRVMAQTDANLCPDIDGSPLVWVKLTDKDKAKKLGG